jgi:transposase
VEIDEGTEEKYRQKSRGRPGTKMRYVKQDRLRFDLGRRVDLDRSDVVVQCDGIFPLITNERGLSELDLLLCYKRRPTIERRLEQLKTDFVVAPVYLKEASRIQELLCAYFFVLLVEALLECELRRAMARSGAESLPLYAERRSCRHPMAWRVIDLFEDVQRHTLVGGKRPPVVFTMELTKLQRRVLRLLGMSDAYER